MLHAREDYNRFQDPAGLIPEDEPVFLLRAQDKLAWHIVKMYAFCAELIGQHQLAEVCNTHAKKMKEWPIKKTPDL